MAVVAHRDRWSAEGPPTGSRPVSHGLRRLGLGAFFVSIAVNAALGIYALLAPDFGETQGKVLGTSLCVTAAVLLALACEPAWERRLLGPVPPAGALLGALGFALAIAGIWAEPDSDAWGRAMGSVLVLAAGCAAASLLVLSRLAPRHEWALRSTLALLALGSVLVGVAPWLGDDPSEWYLRGMGIVLIALAAFAVTVPVLHWIDRGVVRDVMDTARSGVAFCPYCGKELAGEIGAPLECGRCGMGFRVTSTSVDLT